MHSSALHLFSSYLSNRVTKNNNKNHKNKQTKHTLTLLKCPSAVKYHRDLYGTCSLCSVYCYRHAITHSFADDSQLGKSVQPQQLDEYIQECILDVKSWVTHSKLKLNYDKTEAFIISVPRISNSILFS